MRVLSMLTLFNVISASENAFKGIFTSLPKPGGGEFGKFYSLPALNDPRIGEHSYCRDIQFPYSLNITN